MRIAAAILFVLLCAGVSHAQVACKGTNAAGAVTQCSSGQTYGCTAGSVSSLMLATDGGRTSIWFQNTGNSPISLNFGDTAATATNGFIIAPGRPVVWTNQWQGNVPGRVNTQKINIIATTGSSTCVFLFTQ